MGFFQAANISSNGMSVQRQIMDIISENLANVNTIRTDEGEPYRRKIPIISTREETMFSSILGERMQQVATVSGMVEDQSPFRMGYDPEHPMANEDGYVEKPNINVAMEMVQMIDATRAYEANVSVFNASKSMASQALRIGA